ncbi:MAG: sigma-54-dependent transcriptional regulator [Bacteroidales bacterium]
MKESILIIDDDPYILNLLDNYFRKEGYTTHKLIKGKPAIPLLQKTHFDVILCDIRLPDIDGTELLLHIRKTAPDSVVIMMTAYAAIRTAVNSIKSGAFDYITKPIHPDIINDLVKKAIKSKQNQASVITDDFLTGNYSKMIELIDQAKLVAPTDMSVLIQGETGSGKEYVARMIHNLSKRKEKKFIAIDCGAIPKELASSELFGHVKGSFTGAISDKKGYFEQASGGTIFLDEIGNLSYETQVKLLRAIQYKVITRVGDTKSIPVDLRFISATNSNLKDQAIKKSFREDLYHRINEFKLELPPLRERGDDILLFASKFIEQANADLNKTVKGFDDDVKEIFKNYTWYGNLRELRNVIKRSVLVTENDIITAPCLPDEIINENPNSPATEKQPAVFNLRDAAQLAEKTTIENALKEVNNNKSEAARLLNIDRKTLYNKIKELGIE